MSLVERSIDVHLETIGRLKTASADIQACADLVIDAFRAGKRLYICGNGGSAADSQHIAAELVGRFKSNDKPALPAMALTTDTSCVTAISNDYAYDQVFVRQLQAHLAAGDVLWVLSVSGGSPNVLAAVDHARRTGAKIIGFTGRKGVGLRERCDAGVVVDHADSDRVQEGHLLAYHIVCELIEAAFTK